MLGRFIIIVATLVVMDARGLAQDHPLSGIRINEIMARGSAKANPSGDWVELHNQSQRELQLKGCFLTDSPETLTKSPLPEIEIPPKGFAIVQPTFRMDGDGEYLALVAPDGETIVDALAPKYPPQFPNVAFGFSSESDRPVFFADPTPGEPNGTGYAGVCPEPQASVSRGFYDEPFALNLDLPGPEYGIRYTLDGTLPTKTHGAYYKGSIRVSGTTILRAVALRAGHISSRVVTHTYIFIDGVIRQPKRPKGFPASWGEDRQYRRVTPADYEMDPRVTKNTQPGYGVREALLDLPSISVVLPTQDLFDGRKGIYSNPLSRGIPWERIMSMEWIDPEGGRGFQVNAGIRMQGNSSRRQTRMQKHSFRILDERKPPRDGASVRAIALRAPLSQWPLLGYLHSC